MNCQRVKNWIASELRNSELNIVCAFFTAFEIIYLNLLNKDKEHFFFLLFNQIEIQSQEQSKIKTTNSG